MGGCMGGQVDGILHVLQTDPTDWRCNTAGVLLIQSSLQDVSLEAVGNLTVVGQRGDFLY